MGFRGNFRRWELRASFGTVGDCFDNAVMESFWGHLQTELLDTRTSASLAPCDGSEVRSSG